MDKRSREGKQPDQGQEDGYAGDSNGVDEAAESPGAGVGLVDVLTRDASDDGGENELRAAQKHADETIESHGVECFVDMRKAGWVSGQSGSRKSVDGDYQIYRETVS